LRLRSVDGDIFHWMRLPLPGEMTPDGEITAEGKGKLSVPDAFRRALASIPAPGATVIITPDTLAQRAANKP
jgi:hypothetical protein